MNVAESVGGVLYHSSDPEQTARALAAILLDPSISVDRIRAAGLEPDLVAVLRHNISPDPAAIASACSAGAAWVLGRRSAQMVDSWEPVITLPSALRLPQGVRRGTAETLVALITEARHRVRISAPFVDEVGLGYLAGALASATKRGVAVELLLSAWNEWIERALYALREAILEEGDWHHVSVLRATEPEPWPHLKVVIVDSRSAYIGSANLTRAALAGRNLELGFLVRGSQVASIELVLDLIKTERREVD